ncbi:MAG TPA: flagellar motor protein MotB [Thermoguttaceae bacterium]|nr:flagellar motor protein MotB [Thermoguttaceae bacterium]
MATVGQQQEDKAEIPEWVVTFGDMMSLLLTFFIMLFSMSEIKEDQRYQAIMDALRKRFGFESTIVSPMPGEADPKNSMIAKLATLGRAQRADTMRGGDKVKAPVGEHPRVMAMHVSRHSTRGGLVTFEIGSAELTDEHKRILQAAAQQIGGKPQKIEIRGHTSTHPLPPGSPYKDHWDLAHARCKAVMEYLVKLGIERRRIRLTSAAENEPKHTQPDPMLLKSNPRVEIFVLPELVDDPTGVGEGDADRVLPEGGP